MRRDHRVYLAVIHRQRCAAVTHIVSSIDGGVAVENLLPSARRQAPRIGAENIPVIKRRVIQTRQNQQLLASSATRERDHAVVVVPVDHIDGRRPRCRFGRHQPDQVLIEAEQELSHTRALADEIFLIREEVVVAEILRCANLFAHQEHWRSSRQRRQTENTAAAPFGILPRGVNQRRIIHRRYDGALGVAGIAGLVVIFVISDLVVLCCEKRSCEIVDVERPCGPVARIP